MNTLEKLTLILDQEREIKEIIQNLSDYCCKFNLSPIFLWSGDEPITITLAKLASYLAQNDLDYFYDDLQKPGIFTATKLIGQQIKRNYIEMLLDEDKYQKKINAVLPELMNFMIRDGDNAGLVSVSAMSRKMQWFEYKNLTVCLEPAIPGALNSSLPLSIQLCTSNLPDLMIRPDPFRFIPSNQARETFERAASYGKPFNKKWLHQLKGIETAQHDPDPKNIRSLGSHAYTTQFIWERLDGDEIQFSCEELPYYGCLEQVEDIVVTRFLHGILNIKTEKFSHLDGALHIFNKQKYKERLVLNLKDHFSEYKKVKLFRTDSPLEFEKMELLLGDFYRWNYLVPEYFTHHH